MELTKKSTIISFFGSRAKVGKTSVSLNVAADLARKNHRVIFGDSFDSDKDFSFLYPPDYKPEQNGDFNFQPTKIEGMRLLTYSKDAPKMSPEKIEGLVNDIPKTLTEAGDFFVFNVKDPFAFPDRYFLLKTDIHVMVTRVETTSFPDIFQQFEKMVFLPVKPQRLCLIFNYTKDIEKAFDAYLNIMKQAMELKINIKLHFLGIMPGDILRMNISNQLKIPARYIFEESSFKGAVSFIGDKIIKLASVINKEDELAARGELVVSG